MGLFGNNRAWRIENTDSGEVVEGDFEALGPTRNVAGRWAHKNSLNQFKPITQYLGGELDTFTFQGRVFQTAGALFDVTEKFNKMVAWTNRDPDLRRPPIVLFSIGDGNTAIFDNVLAFIESVSDISYDSPNVFGGVRGITFTINLREFNEFSLENEPPPETRYANAKEGEYMELLAEREYGQPLMGDIIRKRHPALQVVETGDVIGLPSFEAIRSIAIVPRSLALRTLTGRKETANTIVRDFYIDKLGAREVVSLIVPEGI